MSAGDLDRIASALSYVPPDDRDIWLKMGMAVKSLAGDDGFQIWDAWSEGSDSYVAKDALAVWKSCKSNGAVTGGSLFFEAKRYGWIDDQKIRQSPRPKPAKSREKPKDDAQAQAARKAALMWDKAKPAPGDHAYLVEKNIQPHGVRSDRGELLVPMYYDDMLCSIQTIKADASGKFNKKFMVDGRASGCYFMTST